MYKAQPEEEKNKCKKREKCKKHFTVLLGIHVGDACFDCQIQPAASHNVPPCGGRAMTSKLSGGYVHRQEMLNVDNTRGVTPAVLMPISSHLQVALRDM